MRYTTQVNRQKINEVIDALQKANQDIDILLNILDVLTQHLRCHQIYTYAHTIFTYPKGFPDIYETSDNTQNGVCGSHYNHYIITRYTPIERTQKYAQAHCIIITLNIASIHIIR